MLALRLIALCVPALATTKLLNALAGGYAGPFGFPPYRPQQPPVIVLQAPCPYLGGPIGGNYNRFNGYGDGATLVMGRGPGRQSIDHNTGGPQLQSVNSNNKNYNLPSMNSGPFIGVDRSPIASQGTRQLETQAAHMEDSSERQKGVGDVGAVDLQDLDVGVLTILKDPSVKHVLDREREYSVNAEKPNTGFT